MNKLKSALFVLMLIIQCLLIIYFCFQKQNLMVDEIWTFNLANSNYYPFLGSAKEIFNQWLTSDFWFKNITVDESTAFNYGAVFHNQAKDVHPPLYYVVIHTVCSFFPNEFSKWLGIVPNILFFVLSQLILLKISDKFFDGFHSLLPCLLYGFSWGAINTVIFIRMYMMLTFWCLLSFYLHLVLEERITHNKSSVYVIVALFFTMLCGFLTQYYYLIFQALLSLCFFIHWFYNHNLKLIRNMLLVSIGVFSVSAAIFPSWIRHIVGGGYRGKEAIRNFTNSTLIDNVVSFLRLLNRDMFGGTAKVLLLALLIYGLYKIILAFYCINISKKDNTYTLEIVVKEQKRYYECSFSKETLLMIITGVFVSLYFIIVSKIAPFKENRYIYNIYPFVSLLSYYVLYKRFQVSTKKLSICMLIAILFISIGVLKSYKVGNIKFIDKGFHEIHSRVNTEEGFKQFIYIGHNHNYHRITSQVLDFAKASESYMLLEKDVMEFSWENLDRRILVYRAGNCKIPSSEIENVILTNGNYRGFKKNNRELGTIYEFYQ